MKQLLSTRLTMAVVTLFAIVCSHGEAWAQTTSEMEINITIGGKTFVAEIEDTETGRAFVSRLPMTLSMSELNGNEKYYYLDESLPTASQYYSTINAGDLMLYGNSCIVLFYGQAGGYSYTRLGKLKGTEGLASAVGSGSINVTFSKTTTGIKSVSVKRKDRTTYAINGSELKQEPTKGMYIKDGKIVIK